MPAHAVPPDDTLRDFLLGTLPTDLADAVRGWLDSDPKNAARLDRFLGRDPLLDAVADRTPDEAVSRDAVERLVRRVADSRHASVPVDADTPSLANNGGTVPRLFTPAVWPPERLGQFRVIRELGHGGMGYVFEAEDETLGRRVAVKVLTPELARQPEAAARFLREARAAAAIDHPNVVPVLHVGEDRSARSSADRIGRHDEGGTPHMVMPLLQGESLSDRLKRSAVIPVPEVVRIGRDIAAGLFAAHAQGLVHRDLKPANVWLDAGTGRARVLDFGLARHGDGTDALTQSGALAGTPAYMAPELLDGKPASVRSDLFALGAVLYECVTGTRAFDGPTITAVLKAVTDHHPTPPSALNPAVPADLSELVVRLLSKNPADRPASAAEVLAALTALVVPPTVPDVPPASAAPTATWTPAEPIPTAKPRPSRQFQIGCVITISLSMLIGIGVAGVKMFDRDREVAQVLEPPSQIPRWQRGGPDPAPKGPDDPRPAPPVRYRGKVDVLLARTSNDPLMRLNVAGALPMRKDDTFRIEAEVDPPAYLYLIWVDPDHDVTPVYPWIATKGWGSRPEKEEPQSKLSLPTDVTIRWTAQTAKPGVATMVLFACEKPLDAPDDVIEKWFKDLPELPLPNNRADGVMWFDNYAVTDDPLRAPFGVVEADAFARWQGNLKKALGGREVFQTAVSFARVGKK